MKHSFVLATCVATVTFGFTAAGVQAQQAGVRAPAQTAQVQAAPSTGSRVAIIDLSKIFKSHTRFQAMTEEMRGTVEVAENALKDRRDSLAARAKVLNEELKKGTPEYKQLEEELTRIQAELQAEIGLKKKEFLEREAAIYYSVYREILDEVNLYCKHYGISLVLRFNSDAVDGSNPQDVIKELNKSVVYYNPSIDITTAVLNILNQRAGGPRIGDNTGRPTSVPLPSRQ